MADRQHLVRETGVRITADVLVFVFILKVFGFRPLEHERVSSENRLLGQSPPGAGVPILSPIKKLQGMR